MSFFVYLKVHPLTRELARHLATRVILFAHPSRDRCATNIRAIDLPPMKLRSIRAGGGFLELILFWTLCERRQWIDLDHTRLRRISAFPAHRRIQLHSAVDTQNRGIERSRVFLDPCAALLDEWLDLFIAEHLDVH